MSHSYNEHSSGIEALDAFLDLVAPYVAVGRKLPRHGTDAEDLEVVATGLLCAGFEQARAVRCLAQSHVPFAASVNVRSLAEAFGDMHYLMRVGDPDKNARICFLFAGLDFKRFLTRLGDAPEILESLSTDLEEKRAIDPILFAEAESRKREWTSTGHGNLVASAIAWLDATDPEEKASTGRAAKAYKLLSWEGHHVTSSFTMIGVDPKHADFGTVRQKDIIEDPEEVYPLMAARLLGGMFRLYREGLPPDGESLGFSPASDA